MKSRNAHRCILGAVVVALLFIVVWGVTATRSSTTIHEAVKVDASAAFALATPASGGAIALDAKSNFRLEALPDPTLTAGAASPFAPSFSGAVNLDQLQNGTSSTPPSWSNGSINNSNSCYAEGDVVPYRAFVTNLNAGPHTMTIEWEFTKGGDFAFDYLATYNFTEAMPISVAGGPCGSGPGAPGEADCVTPVSVGTFPAPTYFPPGGYGGEPLASTRELFAYNVVPGSVSFSGYTLTGSTASNSDISITITFTAVDPTKSVGFFWGGHLAKGTPATWGVGNGSGSISGAPFHMRVPKFDGDSAGNEDRSIQTGAICLPPQASITADAGPYCPGSVHTASAPAGAGSYTWEVIGGTINSGQGTNSISFTVTAACGGNVSISLKACNTSVGCTADACCNQATTTIPVNDTEKPTVTFCPSNATIQCPATPVFGTPTFSDNCDPNLTITSTDVTTPGSCPGTGSVTRTTRATDDCGNFVECSQTITVVDTTAPVIGQPGPNATIECPATPVFTPPTATDTCDPNPVVSEVSDVTTPGSCPGAFTRTKTWRATDACGNASGTVSQTITVVDTTAPVIGQPGANATIECPATPVFTPPTATDTCDPNPVVSEVSDVTTPGSCPGAFTRTKTWRATDACGNVSGTVSQTITVVDTTPPTFTCPGNVTVQCLSDVPLPVTSCIDCDTCGSVEITSTDVNTPGPCGPACGGRIERTYTATDACGNTATCKQIITYGIPPASAFALGMQELIEKLLSSGDLVVGELGARSLTIPGGSSARASASCLLSRLPVDGSANALEDFGDKTLDPATCQTSPSLELQDNGTWRSLLLGQTVSLALNLRADANQQRLRPARTINLAPDQRPDVDFALGSLLLTSTVWSQRASPGTDGILGTGDDELDPSSARMQFMIPASVLSALGPNATVPDLLKLANSALVGQPTGDATISDLTAALDAINRSFDFGRRRRLVNLSRPAR